MRVHWFQHVVFEDLGCIAPWLAQHGHSVTRTRWYADDTPPPIDDIDALIVMGGPMNVDEEHLHPWLAAEKTLIRAVIDAGKPILGICLGAQLVARTLGAAVTRNAYTEIGWFDVTLDEAARGSKRFAGFPDSFCAFHWHGDTFAIPDGARLLMGSQACAHQAFQYGERVLGLQFHLEVTAANARAMYSVERPAPSRYVQDAEIAMNDLDRFAASNRLMFRLLENWLA